jgi:hypothetical protein
MFHYRIQGIHTALCGAGADEQDNVKGLTPHMNERGFFVIVPGTEWGAAHIHTKADEVWSFGRPHCTTCISGAKMLALNPQYT